MRPLPAIFALTIGLLAGLAGISQDTVYRQLYDRAESFYNATNPNSYTDSMALLLYTHAISEAEISALANRGARGVFHGFVDSLLSEGYMKIGILRLSGSHPRSALSSFLRSVAYTSSANTRPALLFQSLLYAGSCYYELFELDSALVFYRKSEDWLEQHPGLPGAERLYNKMGVLYFEFGDYRRSIPYFAKALALVEIGAGPDNDLAVNYRNNIASAWLKLQQYDTAIRLFKQLLPLGKYRDELFYNIGSAYLDAGQPSEAISWMRRSRLRSQSFFNNFARCWLSLDRLDSASYYLHRALAAAQKLPGYPLHIYTKDPDVAATWKLTGDLNMAAGRTDSALSCYQHALILLDGHFHDPDIRHNPVDFWGIQQSFGLFDLLRAKAIALSLRGIQLHDTTSLNLSFSTYLSAIRLAQRVQRLYVSDDARLFLAGRADSVYREAVSLAYRIFQLRRESIYLRRIFELVEAGKASVLQARLGDPGALALPQSLREVMRELRSKRAEAARVELGAATPTGNTDSVRNLLRELEIGISALQDRLDRSPEYLAKQHSPGPVDVAALQASLSGDAAFVSYYYSAGKLFCLYLTSQDFGYAVSDWDSVTIKDISLLRQQLNEVGTGDQNALEAVVHRLSVRLIDPVFEKIKTKPRWVIAPYNEIAYLPFELLTTPDDQQSLVHRFALSYSYSANISTLRSVDTAVVYRVLALAPFTEAAGGMSQLPSSAAEVAGLPGKVLTGTSASPSTLMHNLPDYPVLHLATHAVADDADPAQSFIALRADPDSTGGPARSAQTARLYQQSICQLDMSRIRLVFLSACETGRGPMIRGEGVISLARAFQYAGSGSVITSLWKADDFSSAYIARRVYNYLQKGMDRDRALQQAKLDYLGDHSIEGRKKLPAYWAHFVLVGDRGPVASSPGHSKPVYILVALFALLALAWKWKKAGRTKRPADER